MGKDERIRFELLTPLCADYYPEDPEESGYVMDGEDLALYEGAVREMVDYYNSLDPDEDIEPGDLMGYFNGSQSIKDKVDSAVVSVKTADGALWGRTTLMLKDYLTGDETKEICSFLLGQYSDGWGEGFEQRNIPVDGGTLNVHFYTSAWMQFRGEEIPPDRKPEKAPGQRPKMKLAGHDGNIFAILGRAGRLLRDAGQEQEAKEMARRVTSSGGYYEALGIISEYVETELSSPQGQEKGKDKNRAGKKGRER